MAAETGKNTKNITRYQLEVTELIREMQNMTKEGKDAGTQLDVLGNRFSELKKRGEKLEGVMRFYASRTKDSAKATANLNTRLSALNTGVGKVTAAEKRLLAEIKKADTARKREAAAVKKSIEAKKKAAAATEKLAAAERKSALAKEKNTKASKVATTGVKGFASGVGKAIGTLSRFAAAGALIGTVVRALKFIFIDSGRAFIEFEKAIANLSAVAGVTGKDLDLLGDAALKAAGQTKFTAVEVIALQTELSKLGFSAKETAEVTSSVAFAAQALGSTLGSTAELVGKLKNQFNLLAEDSDEIVDILVTTINNSALSLETFGVAIQYVGPIARDLGLSLGQTSSAMAVLADNGFTASRIGTGLRGILTELGSTSADVQKELKGLAKAQLSLGDAVDLVGKRNAAQLITLLANIEVLEDSNNKYYEAGRALEAAAIQTDSLAGNMEILKSEVNKFQVSLGDAIISSTLFGNVISYISEEAGNTIAAFKAIKDAPNEFNESLKNVAEGADVFEQAVVVAAAAAGESVEDFRAKVDRQLNSFPNLEKTAIGRFINGINNAFLNLEGRRDEAETVNGLVDSLTDAAAKIKDNVLIEKSRNEVAEEYNGILQTLITNKLEGLDVDDEAIAKADELLRRRIKERKLIEAHITVIDRLNGKKGELTATEQAQLAFYEDEVLKLQASEKALEGFQRRFANLQTTKKEAAKEDKKSIKIDRRKANNYRDLIRQTDSLNDSEKRRVDLIIETNEANKDFQDNSIASFMLTGKTISNNLNLIDTLEKERQALLDNISEGGENTEQRKYNVGIMQKEIETLDGLIFKRKEENAVLMADSGLSLTVKNTEKALGELKRQYDEGDITGSRLKQLGEKAYEDMVGQLLLLAGGDPELLKLANSIIDNFPKPGAVDWDQIVNKGIEEAISTTVEALSSFNDVALENTKNRLEAEKDALKSRYETEDYLAKQQLENGLINEAQYRARQKQLRKKQIAEENAIDKKLFDAENKKKKNDAKVDFLEALASIIPTLIKEGIAEPTTLNIMAAITGASAAASYAAEVSAINQSKFYPKKFATGGMVNGPSHEQGGVPFSVQGQGGYEMEGGEFIVNKRAASLHRDLLDKINGSVRPNLPNQPMKYAQGGAVSSTITNVSQQSADSVNYLKAIAEATSTNAMNSSRPVRAFVTSTDLRRDESARRIKENNTTI
tara:strand:- start:1204 stop:4776 length:3573 start_codon:yes stop_codon:yes gene_type:complete